MRFNKCVCLDFEFLINYDIKIVYIFNSMKTNIYIQLYEKK